MAGRGAAARQGSTIMTWRTKLGIWVVMALALGGFAGAAPTAAAPAAGIIDTVAERAPLDGQPLAALGTGSFIGADADGDLYLSVGTQGVLTAPIGGTTSYAVSSSNFGGLIIRVSPTGEVVGSTGDTLVELAADGSMEVIAGTGVPGYSGDSGLATSAQIAVRDFAFGSDGSIYIAGYNTVGFGSDGRIRKIDAGTGIITTIAGTGTAGNSGDTGPATSAQIEAFDVGIDGLGRVLFTQKVGSAYTLRRIESGNIDTVYTPAGTDTVWFFAGAPDGSVYFTEGESTGFGFVQTYVVKKLATGGGVTTVAGSGPGSTGEDGGPAIDALLSENVGLDVLPDGSVIHAGLTFESGQHRIRRFEVGGNIETVAGLGDLIFTPTVPSIAIAGDARLVVPGFARAVSGTTSVVDARGTDRMARMANGDVELYEVTGTGPSFTTERAVLSASGSLSAFAASTIVPRSPTYGADGTLYYFDDSAVSASDCRIRFRRADNTTGVLAGGECGTTTVQRQGDLAVGPDGSVYNTTYDGVIKVSPAGVVSRFAGKTTGCTGETGNGLAPLDSCFNFVQSVVADSAGNVFLSTFSTVRRIDRNGIMTIIAGRVSDITTANTGNGGAATSADLALPSDLAFDADGNLYIATLDAVRIVGGLGSQAPAATQQPLVPGRIMDTRNPGGDTVDDVAQAIGQRAAGSTYELLVAGRGGVAANASAAVLNVTVTNAAGEGFITVWPCGVDRPNASNLNYKKDSTIPNAVITKIGTAGKVCFYTEAAVDLIVDVNGEYPAGTSYSPLVPARLLDSRNPGGDTIDDIAQAIGKFAAGASYELQVTGRGGVPSDAGAAVLNVTVTNADGEGFITVWPCGVTRPNASNLNYKKDSTIPNAVITKIGTGGKVCFYTEGAVDLIVDVNGQYPTGTAYSPVVPARLLDSRNPGGDTIDDISQAIGKIAANTFVEVVIAGRGGVPADATAAVLNVTATNVDGEGYVTVWPCGVAQPNASSLNYLAGATIPNAVVTKIGTGGKVCFYSFAAVDLIVDVNGYVG